MKRAALIKGSAVVNTTIFPDSFSGSSWDGCTVVFSDTAAIGDTWDGATFSKPAPVTPPLTRLQVLAAKTAAYTAAEQQELLHLIALKAAT